MRRRIIVETSKQTPIEEQKVELVERKGIGHPDSIADGLAESISRALCKEYIRRFGEILHHNTDETQIVGGLATPCFGGGDIIHPIYILLVGRAITDVGSEKLPVGSIAIKSAKEYLRKNFKHLDVTSDVVIDSKISMGSADLRKVFSSTKLLANDTSFGVGYAPLSETEEITLNTERYINGKLKKRLPEVGEDVKVMAFRNKDRINLTVAAAMVGSRIPDVEHYTSVKEELKEAVHDYALKFTERDVTVDINTADNYKRKVFYLTVTGLSLENGDDGSVGRGNRTNGLITPNRPMSLEAPAGKNPVRHVGKLYNILSIKIAEDIVREGNGVKEAHVKIVSQIGKPIEYPNVASISLILEKGVRLSSIRKRAYEIADNWLENIREITKMVVDGKVSVF